MHHVLETGSNPLRQVSRDLLLRKAGEHVAHEIVQFLVLGHEHEAEAVFGFLRHGERKNGRNKHAK